MIKVDIHENRSELYGLLKKLHIPMDLIPQEIGDYNIEGENFFLCSELKSAEDYLNSIETGILNNELFQMSTAYDFSLLIVHGDINKAVFKRKMDRELYFEFMAGCVIRQSEEGCKGTISVLNFPRVQDVAIFFRTLHKIITSGDTSRGMVIKKQKMPILGRKLASIQSFPNIRKKRAIVLKNRFKTIANICNASRMDLMSVPSIGKKTADELYDYVHEE